MVGVDKMVGGEYCRYSEGLIDRLGLVGFMRRGGGETGSAGIEKEISVFTSHTIIYPFYQLVHSGKYFFLLILSSIHPSTKFQVRIQ